MIGDCLSVPAPVRRAMVPEGDSVGHGRRSSARVGAVPWWCGGGAGRAARARRSEGWGVLDDGGKAAGGRREGCTAGHRAAGVVAMVTGLVCAVVGVIVVAGWAARGTAALRWPGRDNPMVLSAAVAFAVTGAALVVLSRGWRRWVVAAAGLDVVLGVLVIAGQVLGRGVGLDDVFVTVYLGGAADSGGRMGVNTAVCFVLAGRRVCWRSRRGGRGRVGGPRWRPRPVR